MGKQWKQWQTLFWGAATADGDCSHEIKRHLLLGRKVLTNLDSILKIRDITLPTKFCLVKLMVFPVVMYRGENWTIKKANHRQSDAFELWCWRRLLRVPWTERRSNLSILKNQFFNAQVSLLCHPYMTTGKTMALTRWTVVGKVMSLLLNMLSRLVITLLPRSKRLLISWL